MIIDHHNHIWKGKPTGEGFLNNPMTAEILLDDMDKGGVDIAGVCSVAQDIQNDYVLEFQRNHPDRIIGYCFVNPRNKDAVDTLRKYLNEGLKGLKLHPRLHGFPLHNLDMVGPLLEVCQEFRVPVFIHGSGGEEFNTPFQFEEVAKAFPTVPVIMGHMGAVNMVDMAVKVATRNANVYLDTSYSVLDNLRTALFVVKADKILMGTDWPGGDFRFEQLKIDLATQNNPEVRVLIKGLNYARIVGMQI
jgi:predicted TIM-barrel fold metal-dependent hydrolase